MRVSAFNDVKIYNLSAGKSLPEWISAKQRKKLEKQDVDLQRRIELIQDLEMPDISTAIKCSKDGQYLIASGTYKPRIRCYELSNLGLKFERNIDAEVMRIEILSDDYSKLCLLSEDRYVEYHAQGGRYYRFRVPKVCVDMAYLPSTCDQYFVGNSSQMYRFNLEQGRFLTPVDTLASGINCMSINPEHNLICVGTVEGKIEAYDPRYRTRVGVLDCGLDAVIEGSRVKTVPAVTALAFRDGLNMGVGTSTGKVLMYDLRAVKPKITKEHMYELPIKRLHFNTAYNNDLVLSLDAQSLKMWDRETGKIYANIEAEADFNDLCHYKDSGLFFMTNDQPKIQAYYIPTLGPAPKFASFLDGLTEELEEDTAAAVYDDYKFVTQEELEKLGLDHLIGTRMMRAHMHGYYMDVRFYRKAASALAPSRAETMQQNYIRDQMDKMREKRVKMQKDDGLPSVNKDLFMKLKTVTDKSEEVDSKKKRVNKKQAAKQERSNTILKDERFSKLFTEKEFQVDETEEAYRLMNPVVSKMDLKKQKKMEEELQKEQEESEESEESDVEARKSEDEDMALTEDEDEEPIEDKKDKKKVVKDQRSKAEIEEEMKMIKWMKKRHELKQMLKTGKSGKKMQQFKVEELKDGLESKQAKKRSKLSLESRLETEEIVHKSTATEAGHTATFQLEKPAIVKKREEAAARHLKERKEVVRRSVKDLKLDKLPKNYWSRKKK